MLKRKIWSKLEDFKANANKKTLLLTGARQVGKTYIVEQFAKARYKSFVEINFVEDAAAKAIFHDVADEKDVLRRITAYAQGKVIPGETLVLFDEVHMSCHASCFHSSFVCSFFSFVTFWLLTCTSCDTILSVSIPEYIPVILNKSDITLYLFLSTTGYRSLAPVTVYEQ